MHLTADPLLLLVALAFLVPWAKLRAGLRRWYFVARLELARRLMQRRHRCTIVVHAETMERATSIRVVRKVRAAPITRPLVLVLDTRGGAVDAGQQILHALAAHRGRVDLIWLAGRTR